MERVWFITENKLPYQLVGPPAGWSLEIERLSPSTRPLHKLRPPADSCIGCRPAVRKAVRAVNVQRLVCVPVQRIVYTRIAR